ncbi:diguanylate cyclase (GGDEF) domain-containing protein [Luteibacter sp. UNCMF331Sha3.1]|nr:diguanylate cyclase (GGDEF) domain-containing protein [Luteibacter sp. UNCMF331Sha3.1]
MSWEHRLRRMSVGQRMGWLLALLLLPLGALSIVSTLVLNDQETQFRESVEESISTLLPLTTLEHYLQRALVDEMQAESHESVPNFAALTDSIDKSFAAVELGAAGTDLTLQPVTEAQQAWTTARPSVQRLVEQVRSLGRTNDAGTAMARSELELAIADITKARVQLAGAVKARYHRAVEERHRQLRWLVAAWAGTLLVSIALLFVFLRSLLHPVRELGAAARKLGEGESGVRVPVHGDDELTALAERFNEMAAYWEASRSSMLNEASKDALTGTLNRRGVLTALESALAAHHREQGPVALFLIDLDHFKAINDHFGHGAGDRALVWVSERMRQMLREHDRLGRYGGDEFLVVLPGTSLEQATNIAQRMARVVGDASLRESAHPAITIGVAAAPDDGSDATSLIEAADRRLYRSKESKRASPVSQLRPPAAS